MKIHEISSERLTIDDIKRIMTEGYKLSLSKGSIERINMPCYAHRVPVAVL